MYWIQHTVMLILPFYLSLQGYPYTLEQFYQAILPFLSDNVLMLCTRCRYFFRVADPHSFDTDKDPDPAF
jgi:hypothetical protein